MLVGLLAARIADRLGGDPAQPVGGAGAGRREAGRGARGRRQARRGPALPRGRSTRTQARARVAAARCHARCAGTRSRYPTRLLQLGDPPAVLFTRGETRRAASRRSSRGPAVALVGSRQASPHAIEMARELGRGLAAAGITVVSGLALGVDASAHVGALEGGGLPGGASWAAGPTWSIRGRTPRLHERIAAKGLLMSELPPGQRPFRWSFPARNRIMAGLCEATVVVEAAEGSGSLITTEFAEDLGRVVGAVPGPGAVGAGAGEQRAAALGRRGDHPHRGRARRAVRDRRPAGGRRRSEDEDDEEPPGAGGGGPAARRAGGASSPAAGVDGACRGQRAGRRRGAGDAGRGWRIRVGSGAMSWATTSGARS